MKILNKTAIIFALVILFLISCEKEISTSIPILPEPVGSPFIISSIPEGAKIYLDGKTSGLVTPDTLTWLEVKNYKVTLKKELYRDTTFQINVMEDSTKEILIDFNSNPQMWGSINCQSNPDNAKIFLNGKFTNKYTPTIIDSLLPGNYKIKYIAKNSRADSTTSTVTSGKNALVQLVLVDTTYWVDYNVNTSEIPMGTYSKIAIDQNDVLWLGGLLDGITKFDGTTWTKYTSKNSGLVNNVIHEIKFDQSGNLWVCTPSGLNMFDGTNWELYQSSGEAGLPSNFINDISFEADGTPIVATAKGLARYKNNKWEVYTFNLPLAASHNMNFFTGIDVDNTGNWWATRVQHGIAYWNGTKWTQRFFTTESNIRIYYKSVRHAENEIWFAHFIQEEQKSIIGLSSYLNGFFDKNSYTEFDNTNINSIEIKNGNEKWISSSKGLYRFVNYNSRTRYTTANTPLTTNDIQDVAFDSKGDAWIVTLFSGIYHFKTNN